MAEWREEGGREEECWEAWGGLGGGGYDGASQGEREECEHPG